MEGWGSWLWYEANFCAVYTAYTLAFSYRSVGSRHMPRRGPVLLIANHESFLDPLAVGLAVRRKIHYMARKTLFKNRAFGSYLLSVGCVPVDQEGVAKEGLKTSLELLQAGKPLLLFPEGERSWTGQMQAFKPGILLLIKRAPVPVVPVGIAGAFEAYPRTAKLPRLSPLFWPANGRAVAAAVGKPIEPARYAKMEREAILEDLFREVKAQVAVAEGLVRRPERIDG
jgi:1-acyl-sn-glycerol-3-phosphate acyltransferase